MNVIDKLLDKLENELCKYADKEELSMSEWKMVFEAVDAFKDMEEIEEKESEIYNDYSSGQYNGMSSMSYASGRGGMSGYSPMRYRRSMPVSYDNGARNGGRSYKGESFKEQLQHLADIAPSEYEKNMIIDMMNNLQNR